MVSEVSDFAKEVLEQSYTKPVLVDFWAPWCGPCRMLGPVLEKLADETDAWTLAKLNTDENQDVAYSYRISSIPAVKLFIDGEVADEFIGALPEPAVRQWLAAALPSETKRLLAQARALLIAGDEAQAEPLLQEILRQEPENDDARLLLARILLFRDPAQAAALTAGTSDADAALFPLRDAIQVFCRLLDFNGDHTQLPEGPGREAYQTAIAALARNDLEAAVAAFLDVVRRDRAYDDDGARKACLAIFNLLGERHPLTTKYRRQLEMALF